MPTITRALGGAALVAALAVSLASAPSTASPAGPANPANPGDGEVKVSASQFGPRVVQVGLDDEVTWTFTSSQGRTVTSDQGFWTSAAFKDGSTFTQDFTSAGRFAYHSQTGPDIRGAVSVPIKVTGSPLHGYQLRWSVAPGGRTSFDVETRSAKGTWHALRRHTTDDGATYAPKQAGRYQIRARTDRGSGTAHQSGWSPTTTVVIS